MRKVRSVTRAPPIYTDRIAGLHRVARPALPPQHVGREAFKLPLDNAGIVFHIKVEMYVRILPVNLSDHARDRHWFGVVVFGPKRVMCERRSREEQPYKTHQEMSSRVIQSAGHYIAPRSPKTCSALIWYSFFLS